MSLYDDITPSEVAAELALVVKRLRKRTALAVVPMLVVEGATDEMALAGLCQGGREQIFLGGNRDLVEQLLAHLRQQPVDGCKCVFLVDCDGRGKTVRLADASELVVTETCDMEADLVAIGVVVRFVGRYMRNGDEAAALVADAQALGMVVSIIRRAANAAGVSMKKAGWQFRLTDIPEMHLNNWEEAEPSDDDVLRVVSIELDWSDEEIRAVANELSSVHRDFAFGCLGKDVLDAVYRLLLVRGQGDARGWSRDYFYRAVFNTIEPDDARSWEVGRRIREWEQATGCQLLRQVD